MTTEAVEVPIPAPSRVAERMRQYRKRHGKGIRCVDVQLHPTQINVLVRREYLEDKDRDDPKALQSALSAFVSDAFFELE